MGFFSDFVSNTVGSAKDAVSNPVGTITGLLNNPIVNPIGTITSVPLGMTPTQSYMVGAAGGGVAMAAPVVAGAFTGTGTGVLSMSGGMGSAIAGASQLLPSGGTPAPAPAPAVTPAKDGSSTLLMGGIAALVILAKVL